MEIETRSAATQLGLSQRQVQRLAQNGRVIHRAVAGRTVVFRTLADRREPISRPRPSLG
ncbi:MAG: hypothetical protein ACJLS2_07115 [Microcella pacifica]